MVDSKSILLIAVLGVAAFLLLFRKGTGQVSVPLDPIQQANQDLADMIRQGTCITQDCQQNYLIEHGVPVGSVGDNQVWDTITGSFVGDQVIPTNQDMSCDDWFASLTVAQRDLYYTDYNAFKVFAQGSPCAYRM